MGANFDFSGWATRNDMECADGRIIRRDAFKENDGKQVSLVWNHQHDSVDNVLGHAILENRAEGVYAYCYLNDTPSGDKAKKAIIHGDVNALSIYANKLKQTGCNVMHGCIKEVSLVLAGANPGAYIETVNIAHSFSGELVDEEAIIFNDVEGVNLAHAEEKEPKEMEGNSTPNNDKTVQDVLDTFTDEQKTVMYAIIGETLKNAGVGEDDNEGDNNMKHNVFDNDAVQGNVLSHSDEAAIFASAKKYGSLRDASEEYLAHSEHPEYGIEHIDYLFPEAQNLNPTPEFIKRDTDWVSVIMNGVKHTPFSRVRSTFANITMDEARARGYIKGNAKKDEVFTLLKRTTDPQTIYKKQKMDRDDIIDITDFNVVSWLKTEMRMMLDEEIARAILIGDGRLGSDEDKISEDHIRSVANDASLYTISQELDITSITDGLESFEADYVTNNIAAGAGSYALATETIISAVVMSRIKYKGTGSPICFLPESLLAMMLLVKDTNGRRIYNDEADLAKAMRVSKIVTCPLLDENMTDTSHGKPFIVIFNPADYNVGADKGGAVNMFEDFDIDYNQQKYLIETRCSGALIKPYSAIVFKTHQAQ